jgi:hypothetical protein
MTSFRLWALALALTCWIAGPAQAGAYEDLAKPYIQNLAVTGKNGSVPRGMNPSPHFITIDPTDWYDAEQAAVSGYSWYSGTQRSPVGGAFRGHSTGGAGGVFGIATEAITSEASTSHVIGGEIAVVSRNPNSANAVKWGMPLIFFNRFGGTSAPVEAGLGDNSYNEGSKALLIQALPRSSVGEFSGWQTGIYFDRTSLDRTKRVPYAAAIDMSDVETLPGVPWYILTWKCGSSRCGLLAAGEQFEIWTAIDSPFPRRLRIL